MYPCSTLVASLDRPELFVSSSIQSSIPQTILLSCSIHLHRHVHTFPSSTDAQRIHSMLIPCPESYLVPSPDLLPCKSLGLQHVDRIPPHSLAGVESDTDMMFFSSQPIPVDFSPSPLHPDDFIPTPQNSPIPILVIHIIVVSYWYNLE